MTNILLDPNKQMSSERPTSTRILIHSCKQLALPTETNIWANTRNETMFWGVWGVWAVLLIFFFIIYNQTPLQKVPITPGKHVPPTTRWLIKPGWHVVK